MTVILLFSLDYRSVTLDSRLAMFTTCHFVQIQGYKTLLGSATQSTELVYWNPVGVEAICGERVMQVTHGMNLPYHS